MHCLVGSALILIVSALVFPIVFRSRFFSSVFRVSRTYSWQNSCKPIPIPCPHSDWLLVGGSWPASGCWSKRLEEESYSREETKNKAVKESAECMDEEHWEHGDQLLSTPYWNNFSLTFLFAVAFQHVRLSMLFLSNSFPPELMMLYFSILEDVRAGSKINQRGRSRCRPARTKKPLKKSLAQQNQEAGNAGR